MIDQHLFYIIGGGFAGIQTIRSLLGYGISPQSITLITPDNTFLFTPLLHEVAIGHLPPALIKTDISQIFPSISVIHDLVSTIDLHTNTISTTRKNSYHADFIVVATGSRPLRTPIDGLAEQAIPLKSLQDAKVIQERFLKARSVAILGGGPTGVEIASETIKHHKTVHLITSGRSLIPSFSAQHQAYVMKYLRKKGINVHLECMVEKITAHEVCSSHHEILSADLIINALGVEPSYPEFIPDVYSDGKKRLLVDEFLRLQGYSHVFIAGDSAAGDPMDAQAATYHGKLIAKNILNTLKRQPLSTRNYKPKGRLVSLGQKNSIAEIGPFQLHGFYVWFLWRTIYLVKMPSIRKRLSVAWVWTRLLLKKQ